MNGTLPLQKIPKNKKDREWKVNNLKYYNTFAYSNNSLSYNKAIERLFKIAAGIMDVTDYSHIQNPYHLIGEQYKKYPEKLRRYDIVSPLFLRALKEFKKRPFEPVVYTQNSNFDSMKQQAEKALIEESLQRKFVNMLIQTGQLQEQEPVEEISPDVIKQKVSTLKDIETISGQKVLDYILSKEDIYSQYVREFYHFICSNRCSSYADVRYDNIIRYSVHPMIIDSYGSKNNRLLEDANVVRARYNFTYEEVIDIFQGEDLSEYPDFFEYLERYNTNRTTSNSDFYDDRVTNYLSQYMYNRYGITRNDTAISNTKYINVNHIQWTSFRLVHFIPNGDSFIEVDEDYQGNDIIYSEWKEEVREGYVVANKYFIGGDCLEFPRYDFNNPFKAKNSYCGITFMDDLVQQISIPEKIVQYQEAYDVVKFKIQYTINKNKDKIATIPLSLIRGSMPIDSSKDKFEHTFGEDEDKDLQFLQKEMERGRNHPLAEAMYFADTTQMLFVDDTSETAATAVQMLKQIDLSLGNYIGFLMDYARSIKAEAEDLFGFNRFVSGDISQRDSVRNVQRGLEQSTAIIDLYYDEFERYQACDLQRLLDLSRYAFRTGKNLTYVRDNTDIERLQIPDNYQHLSYGIFVRNSAKTKEVLDRLKNLANEFIQNGMKPSVYGKLISQSSNYASIIKEIEDKEIEMQKQQEMQAQADRDNQIKLQEMQMQDKQADRDIEKYKIDTNAEVAINKTIATLQSMSIGNDDDNAVLELEKIRMAQITELQNNMIKKEDIKTKKEIAKANNDTKRFVAEQSLKVAKENKGK